jgi:magnesium-transporting ATPase (P-type)
MVAAGQGALRGILFRNAAAIEHFRLVDTLIVDKTGTLTERKPAFDRVVPAPGVLADEVLRLVATTGRRGRRAAERRRSAACQGRERDAPGGRRAAARADRGLRPGQGQHA